MAHKKHVLVYGDSLTWGIIPATRLRHEYENRWPQVVQTSLREDVLVSTQAIPGRTTVWDDPFRGGRNGRADFLMVLQGYAPVDLVVIMLGVNDLQVVYSAGPAEAAKGVGLIAQDALTHVGDGQAAAPKVLIVAPTLVIDSPNSFPVMKGSIATSALLAGELKLVAAELNCAFFDASNVALPSVDDGVHLDIENTIKLGKALIEPIKQALES